MANKPESALLPGPSGERGPSRRVGGRAFGAVRHV